MEDFAMRSRRDFLRSTVVAGGITAVGCGSGRRPGEGTGIVRGNSMSDHLHIGAVIYPEMDQIDFTGPFEVLSRLPDSTFHVLGKENEPIRDVHGLLLTPERTLAEAPRLDVLVVPGGHGQEALMEDEAVLGFLRRQAAGARYVFSVCTGALLIGAAGLLKGVRATTHWSSFHLLPYFGAIPVDARVVVDGKVVSAAGVTAGIDGALRLAALLRGTHTAQRIQLNIQYAPEPPFDSGTPSSAPQEVLVAEREAIDMLTQQRRRTARRIAKRLQVTLPDLNGQ
jgi:cyclohexyl-isocyanide hydratase